MDGERAVAMSKILVVGGAGYVGSVLVEELLERGYALKVLDRLYYGEDGLQSIRDRVELTIEDMRTVGPEVLEDVDAVVNLADGMLIFPPSRRAVASTLRNT